MTKNCFFCDIQNQTDKKRIADNQHFFARFDDFPISKGHCEIITKQHIVSFFDLNQDELQDFFNLLKKVKKIIDQKFKPNSYNIGVNEGLAAGRTVNHLHIHLIPRFTGDVKNPKGGVRNIIPNKADYIPKMKKIPEKQKYL